MSYARGKYAYGFCDRTGFRYPLKDLVPEFRNGHKTGFLVGRDVVDPDQPQNFLGRVKINDPQSLLNPRPDTSQEESRELFGFNPVWNPAQYMVASVGRVTVSVTETGNEIVNVTGVNASSNVGSVTVSTPTQDATVNLTGVGATSAVGSASAVGVRETYTITVFAPFGSNVYAQDGAAPGPAGRDVYEGSTYRYDQSNNTNSGHPLRFSTTPDGTHGGGVEYTTGVTYNGTPGDAGAYTQITVASGAPTLYTYCSVHSGMGYKVNTLVEP